MTGERRHSLGLLSKTPLEVSSVSSTNEHGPVPIIFSSVHGLNTPFLVDSGATINLIYFDKIPQFVKNLMHTAPCNIKLNGFSNEILNVTEKVTLPLNFNGTVIDTEFYLARHVTVPSNYFGILGTNFLTKNCFNLDFANQVLRNNKVCLQMHSHLSSANIAMNTFTEVKRENAFCYTSASYSFPPSSEKIVKIHCGNSKLNQNFSTSTILLEPTQLNEELLVGRSVSYLSKSNSYYIKIANFTSNTITLPKNCKVATMSPIYSTPKGSVNKIEEHFNDDNEPFEVWGGNFNLDHLKGKDKQVMQNLLENYKHLFANTVRELEGCDTVLHNINLKDSIPVRQRPYRVPYHLREELDKQINELLESDIIQESDSPYAAPVLFVKKSDGTYRLVCDFRKLNEKTIDDSFPIPNITEMIDSLSGAKFFSTLDLTSGFYQMKLHPDDTAKTGFSTSSNHFEWKRVPFGLKNAPGSFQRLMSIILGDLSPLQIGIYIDDIVIASKTLQEHLEKLKLVFDKLTAHHLKLKPSKCKFLLDSITYLGFHVTNGVVQPDPSNLNVVQNFKIPANKKNVRQFLGLTGFYRRFIENYALKALPLTNLTKNDTTFIWSTAEQKAFDTLKTELLLEPILNLPDFAKPFVICTDASNHSLGAILCQEKNNFLHPVAYASRKLKGAEIKYSTVEKEALGVVWAVTYYKHYLLGKHFTVYCDQASLSYVLKLKDSTSRIARWIMTLSQYDYKIIHKPGKLNVTADYLSRNVNKIEVENEASINSKIDPSLFDRIATTQISDSKCSIIKNQIQNLNTTPKPLSLLFYIKNNILYCVNRHPKNRFQSKERIFVPLSLVPEVLKLCHDNFTAGHGGFKRTLFKIRQNFYWPKMYSHVLNYIKSCKNCLEKRGYRANQRAPIQTVPITSYPFEKIAMDIVGPFCLSTSGNKYLLVITDYFTRWPEAYPLQNAKSETILKCLENFISTHGIPKHIVTDKGSNFISKVITKFYKKMDIIKHTTTSFHPQADGVCERLNGTLIRTLSYLVNETQEDWDRNIQFALLAHRTAKHSATGETPSYLLYGRDIILPESFLSQSTIPKFYSVQDYTEDLMYRLQKTYNCVKKNLTAAATNQETVQHKRAVKKEISVGDLVLLYYPVVQRGQTRKLTKFNKGPFKVVSKTTPVNFVISSLENPTKTQTVHIDRLTLFPKRETDLLEADSMNELNTKTDEVSEQAGFKRYNLRPRTFRCYKP